MWRRQVWLSIRLLAAPSSLALFILLALLGLRPAVAQNDDDNIIKIGIISPKERSRNSACEEP